MVETKTDLLGKKVLLADYEPFYRKHYVENLTEHGCIVDTRSLEEVISRESPQRYDYDFAIVCIPPVSEAGPDAIELLKQKYPERKVIAANVFPESDKSCFRKDIGADGYVSFTDTPAHKFFDKLKDLI